MLNLTVVPAQVVEAAHHLIECALSAFRDAIGVVQLFRAIDAQPDQHVVLFEERGPLVVDQDAIGLKRCIHLLAWAVGASGRTRRIVCRSPHP